MLPSTAVSYVLMSIFIIDILIAFYCQYMIFKYRRESVIKKTSPLFSQLILIGIHMVCISQIIWNIPQQTTGTCFSKVWLIMIGFPLMMGSTLAKLYRIYIIFYEKKTIDNNTRSGTNAILKDKQYDRKT